MVVQKKSHTPKGKSTRDHIITVAERLFVAGGFHGTSVRDVAAAAEVPLASVVYHFARKEQLYAAVLEDIGNELVAQIAGVDRDSFVATLIAWMAENPERVKLGMRELLDNPSRIGKAIKLPIAPFVRGAAAVVGGHEPELAVLHLIGAISYVTAAWPTIARIIGADRAKYLAATYTREATALADRVLPKGKPRRTRARASRTRSSRASS